MFARFADNTAPRRLPGASLSVNCFTLSEGLKLDPMTNDGRVSHSDLRRVEPS